MDAFGDGQSECDGTQSVAYEASLVMDTRSTLQVLRAHLGDYKIDKTNNFNAQCIQCTSMFRPVAVLCALVLALMRVIPFSAQGTWPYHAALLHTHDSRVLDGAVNASVIMCAVVLFTLLFCACFAFRRRRLLLGILSVSYGTPPVALAWVLCVALRERFGIGVDVISFVLVCWNLLVVVPYVTLQEREDIVGLSNACILISAFSVSWIFLCLDESTIWFTLALMVLWDLFAVLSVCGPIRYVMDLQKHWHYMAMPFELPRGLSYVSEFYTLGTGDLVFYTVLFGRACISGFATGVACFLAILIGFILTALYTMMSSHAAVPALPLTVVIGTFTYFFTQKLLVPFLYELVDSAAFM